MDSVIPAVILAIQPKIGYWGLLAVAVRYFANFIGYSGVILIIYGTISAKTGKHWEPFDVWADTISAVLTLIGTLLTASSIYFYPIQPTPPEQFSLYISAPITIFTCFAAIIFVTKGNKLPHSVINGFALLAIAGAILRIQPRPNAF